jgi:hypothetical protein
MTMTAKKASDNLSTNERKALRSLQNRSDILIKPADKGGAIVLMDRSDYITEGQRQLNDTQTYTKLDADITQTNLQKVTEVILKTKIPTETQVKLIPKESTCSKFYLLPKIHKGTYPVPGRPIVSSCSCPTNQISIFLDFHLRPLVTKTTSYIKDTTHFLQVIEDLNQKLAPFPIGTTLCTADVKSLYTNIDHKTGLKACKATLNKRPKKSPPTMDLIRLLELILTLNAFEFDSEFYCQLTGTAMGTNVAPSYANTTMAHIEDIMLKKSSTKPLVWKRFIDDIFFIWTGNSNTLLNFQNHLNSSHDSIKFTFETSNVSVPFLDVAVSMKNQQIEHQSL